MSDNPWVVDLSPERMPEGWTLEGIRRAFPKEIGFWVILTPIDDKLTVPQTMARSIVGAAPTPAAAVADAIRKAREAGDDNG